MKVVIIGNGVAGITCANTVREREFDAEITVIGEETKFFFSRTALMYAYMDLMEKRDLEPHERDSYKRQNITLLHDSVVNLDHKAKTIKTKNGEILNFDKLVFAVGAKPNMFPWPGIDAVKEGIVNFVSMQDLEACESLTPSTKKAVVVGGGLIGIELVECLIHHGVEVTFLIREPFFWPVALGKEEARFVTEHMKEHGVNVVYEDELAEVLSDSNGRVSGIKTKNGQNFDCQMLGVAIGVRPNIAPIKNFKDKPKLGRGIVVDQTLKTSLDDVYACGDCAEIHAPNQDKPLIELIWYSAKRQGKLAAENLLGDQVAYEPPIFFNSSKFFEIEYTTVGQVMSLPNGTPTLYLRVPNKNSSLRIVHDNTKVLGFNALGSRWDHELLEKWIANRRSPEYCLAHLKQAQFDVEFGRIQFETVNPETLPLEPLQG